MTEFGFIESIRKSFEGVPSHGFEGIGDDCAVLPLDDGSALVFTTDVLVEGVHFLRTAASAAEIGRKSLAVNLSDVAAMGASPVASMLSIALTDDAAGEWADEFMAGYRELSERYSVPLVGGDTSKSKSEVTINVVAIGRVRRENIKRRSAARAGDIIVVGGVLGGSAEGLKDILAGRFDSENARIHKNPEPQVELGCWLGSRTEVHAMMDLSDGLASDLRHILKASGVGAVVDVEKIPAVSDVGTAVCGGEDYKLLFTVSKAEFQQFAQSYCEKFGSQPFAIGRIVASEQHSIEWFENGKPINPEWTGYSHF